MVPAAASKPQYETMELTTFCNPFRVTRSMTQTKKKSKTTDKKELQQNLDLEKCIKLSYFYWEVGGGGIKKTQNSHFLWFVLFQIFNLLLWYSRRIK